MMHISMSFLCDCDRARGREVGWFSLTNNEHWSWQCKFVNVVSRWTGWRGRRNHRMLVTSPAPAMVRGATEPVWVWPNMARISWRCHCYHHPQQPNGQLPRPDQWPVSLAPVPSFVSTRNSCFDTFTIVMGGRLETISVPLKGKMKICGYLTTMWNPKTVFGNTKNFRKCFPIRVKQTFLTNKNCWWAHTCTPRQFTHQINKAKISKI